MLLSGEEELSIVNIVLGECAVVAVDGLARGLLVAAAGAVGDTGCPRVACEPIAAAGDGEVGVLW
jgi:hypothetical protein